MPTIEALIIIGLVIAPGYICARFARGVIAFSANTGDLRSLLPAITLGTLVHIIVSPWTSNIFTFYEHGTLEHHRPQFVAWGLFAVILVPVLLGVGIGWLSNQPRVDGLLDRIGLGYIDRTPSAWDFVMRLQQGLWVRVWLHGVTEPIGGRYDKESFASLAQDRPDLYIQEVWLLDEDDNFLEPYPDSFGIWISHQSISHIEFFIGSSGEMHDVSHGGGVLHAGDRSEDQTDPAE